MYRYRVIMLIISGVLVGIFAFVVLNVFVLENRNSGYEVDKDYVSRNIESDKDIETKENESGNRNYEAINEPDIEEESLQSEDTFKEDIELVTQEVEGDKELYIAENENIPEAKSSTEKSEFDNTDNQDIEVNKDIKSEAGDIDSSEQETKEDKVTDEIVNEENSVQENNENIDQTSSPDQDGSSVVKNEDLEDNATSEYTGQEWVDEKIDEHIDEIAENDLEAGLSMEEKIDETIVTAYLEDGLTEEEKAELIVYLKSVLTSSEYERLKVLFDKYYYILE